MREQTCAGSRDSQQSGDPISFDHYYKSANRREQYHVPAADFDLAHERLRETCVRLGIVFLEREVITAAELFKTLPGRNTAPDPLPAVRFIGTTLWTDFDALSPLAAAPGASLTPLLKARDKAFRAANFYLRKALTSRHGQALLAEQVRAQALVCQDWLRAALAQPFDGVTVVITHFAPSLRSADPRYGLTPGTAGFCNALDELLPSAQLWLHGHLHCASDYVNQGCRVVANPLGYARKSEQAQFVPQLCLELPQP